MKGTQRQKRSCGVVIDEDLYGASSVESQPIQTASQQWHEARFILSIKERHILSQAAVDTVLSSTSDLVSAVLDGVLSSLGCALPAEWMKLAEEKVCASRTLFSGLSTSYLQKKYFKEVFHLVEPVPVQLGSRLVWKKNKLRRKIARVYDSMYYVPLLESMETILNKPDIKEVETHHCSTDGVLRDFCDGHYVKELPGVDNNSLLFAFYYDELEVVNPLGSRRGKHKLGMFYWMLLNIHPLRSHLSFATSVTSLGCEFRVGAVVCLRRPCDSDYPLFGEIVHIAVQHDQKFFVVHSLSTYEFSHHFFAYSVVGTEDYQVVEMSKLALHQVLHKYYVMSTIFVPVQSCDHVELFV